MDQATLVGPDLRIGLEIVSVLEDAQIEEITALFALFPEYADWRLVLSSASLDQNHSLQAGKRVHEILQGKFDYNLPILMILPVEDPFMRDLRESLGSFRTGSFVSRGRPVWVGGQRFGERYVTEAFLISCPGFIR